MADNVELNAGSGGAVLAADDIGGVWHQRVKVEFGGDGSASDVAAANPLPVSITDGTDAALVSAGGALLVDGSAVTQPVSGTVTANLGATDNGVLDAIQAATEATQAAVEGTLAVSNAGLTELAAAINASSQVDVNIAASGATVPVSNAGLTALNGAIAGTEVQVDIVGSLPAGTNAIGKLAANSGVDIGDVDVTSIAAGSNLIGDVGLQPRTGNGLSIFRSIDLDETEEEVKATAGQVYGIWFSNLATSTRFLKFYNDTAANVSVGTTTPVITLALPGNSSDDISGVFSTAMGITFSSAITVAATTGVADNDTGAPGANEVLVNVFYK